MESGPATSSDGITSAGWRSSPGIGRTLVTVSQPFRDDFAAALDKAAVLERENEELRDELARLRGHPSTPPARAERPSPPKPEEPPPPVSPPDSLEVKTLDRLERLSQEIDAHARETEPVPSEREAPAPPPPLPTPIVRPAPPLPPRTRDEPSSWMAEQQWATENAALRAQNEDLVLRLSRSYPRVVVLGGLFLSFLVGYCAGHVR
jgi:hypothetical protein